MKPITVLLADDNTFVREEFRKLLELEDDLEVVGEAINGLQAVDLVKNQPERSVDTVSGRHVVWHHQHVGELGTPVHGSRTAAYHLANPGGHRLWHGPR